MREIKFRALDENDIWVFGSYVEMQSKSECIILEEDNPFQIVCKRETLGQLTGLLDKNGKEIFEGDIIQRPSVGVNMLVRWNSKDAKYDLTSDKDDENCAYIWWTTITSTDYEITGNIHENKEFPEIKS